MGGRYPRRHQTDAIWRDDASELQLVTQTTLVCKSMWPSTRATARRDASAISDRRHAEAAAVVKASHDLAFRQISLLWEPIAKFRRKLRQNAVGTRTDLAVALANMSEAISPMHLSPQITAWQCW